MKIQTRAMLETLKVLAVGLLVGLAFNLIIEFFGLRIATLVLISAFLVWFLWVVYNINLSQLRLNDGEKDFDK